MTDRESLLDLARRNNARLRVPVAPPEPGLQSLCGYTPSWSSEVRTRHNPLRIQKHDVMDIDAWAKRNRRVLYD